MRNGYRSTLEIVGVLALFLLFLASAAYYERAGQEKTSVKSVSTVNYASSGSRALYTLLQEFEQPVDRLTTDWFGLKPDQRELVVMEPYDSNREPTKGEVKALDRWVRGSGTLVYFVSEPARPTDPDDPLMGDIAVLAPPRAGETTDRIEPAQPNQPVSAGVHEITVKSPVRLSVPPRSKYAVLYKDRAGVVAVMKNVDKGRVFVIADGIAATNESIKDADNAILLMNLMTVAPARKNGAILFDEYHHGIGFEVTQRDESGGGVSDLIPAPIRLALWQCAAIGLLLVWNGNKRFGALKTDTPSRYRPPNDYVTSMARLYRRAGASNIAVGALFAVLIRDLSRALDMAPNATCGDIARRAAARYRLNADDIAATFERANAAGGGERISEAQALDLAAKMERLRRDCDLVGN